MKPAGSDQRQSRFICTLLGGWGDGAICRSSEERTGPARRCRGGSGSRLARRNCLVSQELLVCRQRHWPHDDTATPPTIAPGRCPKSAPTVAPAVIVVRSHWFFASPTDDGAEPVVVCQEAHFDDAASGGTPVPVRSEPLGLIHVIDLGSGPLMGGKIAIMPLVALMG